MTGLRLGGKEKEECILAEGSPQEAATTQLSGSWDRQAGASCIGFSRAHMKSLEGLKYHRIMMI
jgi:hypothetical protein